MDLTTNKNLFSNNYIVDVFLFITSVISLLVTNLAIYLLCKHKKLRMLVASLALQQVREVGTVTTQEDVTTECKIQIYIILALTVTIFGLVMFATLHSRILTPLGPCGSFLVYHENLPTVQYSPHPIYQAFLFSNTHLGSAALIYYQKLKLCRGPCSLM